ncbi:MAG: carboxymuconolactone decarboxylase family protein [Mycobacterium pseudokansasii]|uniref:carboxymuconolactone decarboxylase family protein n=1 Tax=Mycobacterium pseudokansasii TaxID=2341080 RepID=UPI0023F13CD0|nr:carboxymuconolactone decarboxylase family protein [Mycobacterium pseudokansasii]MBY0386945.1 carboxymuconolactone decarboxylase family protein [Mycobacterium pseudokansasii]
MSTDATPDSRDDVRHVLTEDVRRARFERGAAVLGKISGMLGAGQALRDELAGIAPALAEDVVAHGYGDVYSHTCLAPPQRQLVTIGILTALGGCESQLEMHLNVALNVGVTPTEIIESIRHAAVYCGMPKALNAVTVARNVFAYRDLLPVTAES